MGSQHEVVGVDAVGLIAGMTHDHVLWDRTVGLFVVQPVAILEATADFDLYVAILSRGPPDH